VNSGLIEDWQRAVDDNWNGKFRLRSGTHTLALVIVPFMARGVSNPQVEIFVTSTSARAGAVKPTAARPGRISIVLGKDNPLTVAHEFGHILGNPDEYDLTPASFTARSGQPAESPPPEGGQTVPGMMGKHFEDATTHERFYIPVLEIVNATRDPALFPDPFTLERL
jgi:hypothetical protein